MRALFTDELQSVNDTLIHMTRLVGTAMSEATQALLNANLERAEKVISNDSAIDELTAEVEQRCIDLIALQQPVATDLRIIIASLRIASSLERMGDLAEHVAKQARLRYPNETVPGELRGTFVQMGALAEAIVAKTGAVFATRDIAMAADINRADSEIDRLHRELFSIVLSPNWSHGVEAAIDITLLSRYYERYADHAVTVSKRVSGIITGDPYYTSDS